MKRDYFYKSLFDEINDEVKTPPNDAEVVFTPSIVAKLKSYTLQNYTTDVENNGLENTWNYICDYVLTYGDNADFLNVKNFGEMYEIGLAVRDKQLKKNNGQYYTPDDIAQVMSKWFDTLDGSNICDVACGTGKLILTFLDLIGKEKAVQLIRDGKLFLYDNDAIALNVCKTSILLKYGKDLKDKINIVCGDFMSKNISLPENCKVISNPPYTAIQHVGKDWKETPVLNNSRELYAVFMEKIITNCKSAVIITPYSFISGTKFYSLRKIINRYSGEIYSFDNVPGNIFCGRKHGIFNTNTSNSVRAAITVLKTEGDAEGFRLTPMIRFKSSERQKLLKCEVLENFLSESRQKISDKITAYYKCFKELQPLFDCLIQKSENHKLEELVSKNGQYTLSMPNTCRYFTTAFPGIMNRNGQTVLHFNDEKKFDYVYCLINSSFAYWHWRLYDGGITYPSGLLMKMPIIYNRLSEDDHKFFKETFDEMSRRAGEFVIKKNNVGIQENIKYPRLYRDAINQRFLKILGLKIDNSTLDLIHSNTALEVNV